MLGEESAQDELPVVSPTPLDQRLPLAPRAPGLWNGTADNAATPSPYHSDVRRANVPDRPRHTEGYYVAFHAVLPGVYPSSYVRLLSLYVHSTLTPTPVKH